MKLACASSILPHVVLAHELCEFIVIGVVCAQHVSQARKLA